MVLARVSLVHLLLVTLTDLQGLIGGILLGVTLPEGTEMRPNGNITVLMCAHDTLILWGTVQKSYSGSAVRSSTEASFPSSCSAL
jgi:hypothetical protein